MGNVHGKEQTRYVVDRLELGKRVHVIGGWSCGIGVIKI